MVKLLLSHPEINIGVTNFENKTCYEAYSDSFGYDEAANLIEKTHLDKL
jgi:hypothetical protein